MQPGLMHAASLRVDIPELSVALLNPPICMLKERGRGAKRGGGGFLRCAQWM